MNLEEQIAARKLRNERRERPIEEQVRESLTTSCRHIDKYARPLDAGCTVGCDPVAMAGGKTPGWGLRLPCKQTAPEYRRPDDPPRATCSKFEPHTEEEIQQAIADHKQMAEEFPKKLSLLWEIKKTAKRGTTGTKPCPLCGGTVHYSVAAYNGHVWMKCDGIGCIQLME